MKFFKRKKRIPGLLTEKVGGIKWRYYENPMAAPTMRVLAYFQALHETQLGIQRKDLEAFVDIQRQAFNSGDFTKAASYLEHLHAFLDLYAIEDNILKLGSSFILYPGESITKMEEHYTLKKQNAVKTNEAVKAFFLRLSYGQIEKLSSSESNFNPTEYLKQPQVRKAAAIFMQLVRLNTSKTS